MAYIGNSPNNIQQARTAEYEFTATAGQTEFTGVDDNGLTLDLLNANQNEVYLNGSRLVSDDDFTVSGDTLTLTSGAALDDIIVIKTQSEVLNAGTYTKAESDSRYVNYGGDIINGDLQVVGSITATDLAVDTNTLYVDSANGRVGVGTIGPGARLQVVSGGDYSAALAVNSNNSAANWARLDIRNTNASDDVILYQDTAGAFHIRNQNDQPILFKTDGDNERARISSTGINVTGWATAEAGAFGASTVGGYDLVVGPYTNLPTIGWNYVDYGAGSGVQFRENSANVSLAINGTNVGIGTTSPTSKLTIGKSVNTYEDLITFTNYATASDNMAAFGFDQSNDTLYIRNDQDYTTGGIAFNTGSTTSTKMFIQTGGNVGIGTTSPGARLHIAQYSSGAINIDSDIGTTTAVPAMSASRRVGEIHAGSNAGSGSDGGMLRLSAGGETNVSQKAAIDLSGYNTTDGGSTIRLYTSGTERVQIDNSGKVLIGVTTPGGRQEKLIVYNEASYLGGVYIGRVADSNNNTSAAILMHKLGTGQGFQFSGKFIINSWTGNKNIDCHITARYTDNAVSVNTNHVNVGNVSSSTVRFCTISYDGASWVAFVKDGGGSGVAYLNAFIEGNIHYVENGGLREITSGYSVTTTHTTF
jgi:hypothetical protein